MESMRLRLGHFCAKIRFFGDAEPAKARSMFGHLQDSGEGVDAASYDVIGEDGEDYVFCSAGPVGLRARNATMPMLKALLTEAYCSSLPDGFITHGALISRAGKRVLLTGAPGAGKTTLTLALCANGFAYGGDDIVRITDEGDAEGVPFAAAVKSGAWTLIGNYVPAISTLTTHERPDGQLARYVAPSNRDLEGPRPIDVVLLLSRERGATARIDPVTPLDAMCGILESGYSERKHLTVHVADALARRLSNARCGRLVYEDLGQAVDLVADLTG
jgi:hypothetical protein